MKFAGYSFGALKVMHITFLIVTPHKMSSLTTSFFFKDKSEVHNQHRICMGLLPLLCLKFCTEQSCFSLSLDVLRDLFSMNNSHDRPHPISSLIPSSDEVSICAFLFFYSRIKG